jgi:S-adenosylmethionine hydrolase
MQHMIAALAGRALALGCAVDDDYPMNRRALSSLSIAVALLTSCHTFDRHHPLVFATDFGVVDGAVSAMKGVALGIDGDLVVHDLTHEITPFDIWEGAFRIAAAAPFWPTGSVIVGVVDPGVGTTRAPIALETESGHVFVGPDNGLFSVVAARLGLRAAHVIDAEQFLSHTFHGRDLFAVVGARLAASEIDLAAVGPRLERDIVRLDLAAASIRTGADGRRAVHAHVTVLDTNYGNVWTNAGSELLTELGLQHGANARVTLTGPDAVHFDGLVPYVRTFGEVPTGFPLLYVNSELEAALALNLDSFAARYGIRAGPGWKIEIRLADP